MVVFSHMVEKELGESNFGFDSLKCRLNHDMEEKGIIAVRGLLPAPWAELPDYRQEYANGNNTFCRSSICASDWCGSIRDVREPDTVGIISSGGAHSFWPWYYIIYRYLYIILSYLILFRYRAPGPPESPKCSRISYRTRPKAVCASRWYYES